MIKTKPVTDAYADGWERIFGKKKPEIKPSPELKNLPTSSELRPKKKRKSKAE